MTENNNPQWRVEEVANAIIDITALSSIALKNSMMSTSQAAEVERSLNTVLGVLHNMVLHNETENSEDTSSEDIVEYRHEREKARAEAYEIIRHASEIDIDPQDSQSHIATELAFKKFLREFWEGRNNA